MVSVKEWWHESFKIGTSSKAIIFIESSGDHTHTHTYISIIYIYIYCLHKYIYIYFFYNINTEYKQNNIVTQWSFVQAELSLECARLYWIFKWCTHNILSASAKRIH